jgi:hypothetical protein
MENREKEAIKQVIEEAYVRGIHSTQDEATIKGGFHPDFAMLVLQDDAIAKVTIEAWLPRIEDMKADNPELWSADTTCSFESIDVAGNAAAAKLQVYKGEVHFSTDYMLLYKFTDGWRIVSKVFSVPS